MSKTWRNTIHFTLLLLTIFGVSFVVLSRQNFEAVGGAPEFFVAPNGNDSSPGTISQPFKTLTKAQRAARATSQDGVKVFVRAGEYDLASTLTFTNQDSGSASKPMMWVNYPGEQPIVRGSWKASSLTQVSGNVYNVPLAGTPAANANLRFIYYNGIRILPARYPDHKPLNYSLADPYQGTRAFTATDQAASKTIVKYRPEDAGVINALAGRTGLAIEIDNNDGIWYWHERAGVVSINQATREVTLDRSLPYNINAGSEYWIEGDRSLLSAGEYYLDPSSKLLTVHLPTPYKTSDRLGIPIIDNLITNQANYLSWHGFKMEEFNQAGFVVQGTTNNVIFRNNEVRNGKLAFTTSYDRNPNLLIDGNHIYEMEHGVSVLGGMYMKNLENSGNVISNNYIHHIDLTEGRGNNAILVDKEMAKVLVINNTVTDTPRHGITVEGPMHTIRNNYVTRAGQLRVDVGGIHTGSRNLLNQGTLIEGNVVENIGTRYQKSYGVWELVDNRTVSANPPAPSFSRMSDDWNSGETERKNIYIQKWGPCISNHGGGYNTFENNYLSCDNAGFFFGGIRVGDAFFDPFYAQAYQKIQSMAAEGYNAALYYQTFPQLRDYPAPANLQNGDIMRNNKIVNNVFEGYRAYKLHMGVPARYEFKGNVVRDLCNQQFRALYGPASTPETYSDLTKAEWQALGLDLDLRELSCSQPLFKAGTYEIDPASPAFGSGFQPLKPAEAGVRNVRANAPTISLPSQSIIASTVALSVDTKTDPYGYNIAEIQYQIRLVGGGAIGGWTKLNSAEEIVTTSHLQDGKRYSFCVRQRNDALNLTGAPVDSLWVEGNCTTALIARPSVAGPTAIVNGQVINSGNKPSGLTPGNTTGTSDEDLPQNGKLPDTLVNRAGLREAAPAVVSTTIVALFAFSYATVRIWHRYRRRRMMARLSSDKQPGH